MTHASVEPRSSSPAGRPKQRAYDVVVIGSGLGGLSAAAILAREGKQVLVVERQDGPGGCAHAFRRGPYLFDPAIHVTNEARPGRFQDRVLSYLGVQDQCTFLPVDSACSAYYPGLQFHAPSGMDAFIEAHARVFPDQEAALRRFFALCTEVIVGSQEIPPHLSLNQLEEAAAQYPLVFEYRTRTLQDVLDQHFTDPRLKSVLGSTWPYVGAPPSEFAFFLWAGMVLSQVQTGNSYCRGSFQNLADAYVTALQRHGGELLLGTGVRRIAIASGAATGVVLENGSEVSAPVVISNADARSTLEEMVGREHLPPAYTRRLDRMRPSPSGFVLYAATDLDLRHLHLSHETFLFRHWDHELTWRDVQAGRPGGLWLNVPTLLDPSLAPPGEHLLILSGLARYDVGMPWEDLREQYSEAMLDELETAVPDIRRHLKHMETATPQTLQRFTASHQGALYGWANSPDHIGSKRLHNPTPVPGLFLSGHWAQPGSGSFKSTASGVQTALMILGQMERLFDLLPGLVRYGG